MIEIKGKEVYSTTGLWVHRVGTELYFNRALAQKEDSVDNYEEVEELPRYTQSEYANKVDELIREKYTISDELAILRQRESKPEEYEEYYTYAEECKERAKHILINRKEE
ncbi:MAG: hypothetical protein U0L54_08515 [Bacteroidales bacterium]|nr:hypothetical protein [Bacteroidales bacterium]